MKRAFLVYGAESSGCRFITSAFIACGCNGDSGHHQRLDSNLSSAGNLIVWRRSFPHGKFWPNINRMVHRLQTNGYDDIHIIVTIRDHHAMIESQIRSSHIKSRSRGEKNIRKAYRAIFSEACKLNLPTHLAVYEAYVHNPKVLEKLLNSLGLTLQNPIQIRDESSKYYKGEPTDLLQSHPKAKLSRHESVESYEHDALT